MRNSRLTEFRLGGPLMGVIAFAAILGGACADIEVPGSTPTSTPSGSRASATAAATPSATLTLTATPTLGAPTSTATALPPGAPSPSPTAAPPTPSATLPPAATVPPGRAEQLAPIEAVEVFGDGSGNATARITSGLPSGCAVYSRAVVTRTASGARVAVYNHLPVGDVVCTMIYGYTTHDVALGGGFTAGGTYTIEVNDKTQRFTPR